MAKTTAICVTIIGILLALTAFGVSLGSIIDKWAIPALVLLIGITKMIRNFSK
jgi:uncharacterized membrane protein